MKVTEASKLAQNKGCVLQITLTQDSCLYWIENSYFIGKPFSCLEDLILFLNQLPPMPATEDNLMVQTYSS